MNKNVKERWLRALRSGEYSQGRGQLFDPETGGYCCLGVLAQEEGWLRDDGSIESPDNENNPHTGEIPGYLWSIVVGLSDDDQFKLVKLNDMDRRNFNEIADWIEENL